MDTDLFMTDDFSELVLKHIIRDKDAYLAAKRAGLLPEDMVNSTAGLTIYRDLTATVFDIESTPISKELFLTHVKQQMGEDKHLAIYTVNQIAALCDWIYNGELNSSYIIPKLIDFKKIRRLTKSKQKCGDDVIGMKDAFLEIEKEDVQARVTSKVRSVKPFQTIVKHNPIQGITFGFPIFDDKFGGIAAEECGLLVGMSGSGKTAVASALSFNAACGRGRKVLYISAEEPMENIVSRWYANAFDISYSHLHRGQAEWEKEQAFREMDELDKLALANLDVVDVRQLAPIDKAALIEVVESKAQEGFVPELVVIDQMDYIKPMRPSKNRWEDYERVSFDLDEFSQHKIANEAHFGLVAIHQGKGEPQWEFGYDDIAGFRGIVKPFDWALGVGRRSRKSDRVHLFSMKVRHSEQFSCKFLADFEHMRFTEDTYHSDEPDKDESKIIKDGARARAKSAKDRRFASSQDIRATRGSNPSE